MRKYLFILMIVLLSFIAYADNEVYYKTGTTPELRFVCKYQDQPCSNTTYCNITLFYNNDILLDNIQLNRTNTYYSISYSSPLQTGDYNYIMDCYGSQTIFDSDFFHVSETGDKVGIILIYVLNIILKALFFVLILFISIVGIRKTKKQSKTPYLFVAILRTIWIISSFWILLLSPMMALFLFHPNFSFNLITRWVLITYLILMFISFPIILINLLYFTSNIFLKISGLDHDQPRTNKVLNDISKLIGQAIQFKNKMLNKIFRGR